MLSVILRQIHCFVEKIDVGESEPRTNISGLVKYMKEEGEGHLPERSVPIFSSAETPRCVTISTLINNSRSIEFDVGQSSVE